MGKFDNYEFRCSALGKIISKTGKLTDGIKTYLNELFIGEIYNVRKEAFGKALDKGKFCEEDGIDMIKDTLLKGKLVVKNKERRRNGFIHGECDVHHGDTVYDVKNALDLFTFGKAQLTWDYYWQLIGYGWLWGKSLGVLFYCLNNMPVAMLTEEKMSLFYRNRWKYSTFESEDYISDCETLEKLHCYDNLPTWEKFKFWKIPITIKEIEQLQNAVIQSRAYLNTLWDEYLSHISKNIHLMGIENPSIIIAHYDEELNTTIIKKAL